MYKINSAGPNTEPWGTNIYPTSNNLERNSFIWLRFFGVMFKQFKQIYLKNTFFCENLLTLLVFFCFFFTSCFKIYPLAFRPVD